MKLSDARVLSVLLWAALTFAVAATVAFAAEEKERKWVNYKEDHLGVQYYYDEESLLHPSPDVIMVWMKRIFPPKSSQKAITTLAEIDCKQGRYRTIELHVTAWDDSVKAYNRVSDWAYISPVNPEIPIMEKHCK